MSTAWDPYYEKDIQKLERVQRKAARFCAGNYNPYASVTEMLQELNWETLATGRKIARLSFMCKVSHKMRHFSVAAYLKPKNGKWARGSNAFKIVVPRTKKDTFTFSFFSGTINEWNSLLERTMSVDNFISKLINSFNFFHCTCFSQILIIFHCISSYLDFYGWLHISWFLPT